MAVKKIIVEDIIRDFNSGLGDVPIMEKYDISSSQYMEILERLNKVRPIQSKSLVTRITTLKTMLVPDEVRESPRCYLALSVLVFDSASGAHQGKLLDLSKNGLKVAGIESYVGESRRFSIQVKWLENEVIESRFIAECRWEQGQPNDGSRLAGFRITDISPNDRRQLQDIIQLFALCDG